MTTVLKILTTHLPGCMPARRCAHCANVDSMRHGMGDTAFEQFAAHNIPPEPSPEVLALPISVLEMSVRAHNGIKCYESPPHYSKIATIGDLVGKTEQDMLRTPNIGPDTMKEIKEALAKLGLSLRPM